MARAAGKGLDNPFFATMRDGLVATAAADWSGSRAVAQPPTCSQPGARYPPRSRATTLIVIATITVPRR
jgi:hypothetical protein